MKQRNLLTILLVGLVLVLPQFVAAAGTTSGTLVENSAIIDYQVGGFAQSAIYSDTAAFLVDNKVDLVVATVDGAAVVVVPGDTSRVLTYTVTNNGNTTQDYSLTAVPATGTFFGVTDNFDALTTSIFVDADNDGVYTAGVDVATYVDELMADSTATVFIVADIPPTVLDLDGALYDLVAQTALGGTAASQGADITNDDNGNVSPGGAVNDIPDDAATVQVVFTDNAGLGDGVYDGRFSSRDVYVVGTAILVVNKLSVVASDPFNGASNPKAIPGATVTYTLNVANSGTTAAGSVSLVDQVPANTTFASGSIGTANSNGAATVTVEYSTDGVAWSAVETAPVAYVRVTFSVVDANDGVSDGTAQLSFNVVIN